jgi:hypothetical protein
MFERLFTPLPETLRPYFDVNKSRIETLVEVPIARLVEGDHEDCAGGPAERHALESRDDG